MSALIICCVQTSIVPSFKWISLFVVCTVWFVVGTPSSKTLL